MKIGQSFIGLKNTMLWIKPALVILGILFVLLYPIINNITKKRRLRRPTMNSRLREIRRTQQEIQRRRRENDPSSPYYVTPWMRNQGSSAASTTTRRQEQSQEEFLTEKDFEL